MSAWIVAARPQQYGNHIVHTHPDETGYIRGILEENAYQSLVAGVGLPEGTLERVQYMLNLPYEAKDPETGKIVSGFISAWKVTV